MSKVTGFPIFVTFDSHLHITHFDSINQAFDPVRPNTLWIRVRASLLPQRRHWISPSVPRVAEPVDGPGRWTSTITMGISLPMAKGEAFADQWWSPG